ncbi:hypothetical protein OY671_007842, partial [Metschnikowia pulcherrima]
MPLWTIYHPADAYSDSDKAELAEKITDLYGTVMPRFYVGIVFQPIDARNFYVAGKPADRFVRIVMEHIARSFPSIEISRRFIDRVNTSLKPYVEDRGFDWEFHIDETPFDYWSINGYFPPRADTEDEKSTPMSDRKTAVITGASSGIGAVYAQRLAAQGYDSSSVARRADRLAVLGARSEAEFGISVQCWTGDLADPADLARLERRLEGEPVAMSVNNAGAGGLGPTATTGADAQEASIRLNVIALTRSSIAALAGFRKAGTGTLVNIASVIAFGPSAGGASYSGSKAFASNFTRSSQMEYADSDIRIQAISPG